MIKTFLLGLALLFTSEMALADCRAEAWLHDWKGGFKTEQSSWDWCSQRVNWWKLDRKNWRTKYCNVSRHGNNNYSWSSSFFHRSHVFNGRYSNQIFYDFESRFNGRVFRNFPARVSLRFDSKCSDSGYPLDSSLDEMIDSPEGWWDDLPEIYD